MKQETLHETIRKVLALTTSSEEGEAAAAAAHLQRLLEKHNLSIADLEQKGAAKPGVRESGHDLGKAAFRWKLDLADGIAEHYYCAPLVDYSRKTVAFVGRPDNVDTLKALYTWLIEQVKQVAAIERRTHQDATGEHVDPLRWQVNFGLGAASRLVSRLRNLRAERARDEAAAAGNALVVSHASEVSDWLEQHYGYRLDGQPTARERRWEEERAARQALKDTDPEAYYRVYPWERPETEEQQKESARIAAQEQKRLDRNRARREARAEERGYYGRRRSVSPEKRRHEDEAYNARVAGRTAAERINLEPFLNGRKPTGTLK